MVGRLQGTEFGFENFQDAVRANLFMEPGADFYHGPGVTFPEAVIAFKDHIPFKSVVLQVFLNDLQGIPVAPAETGGSHADLYFFSDECHVIVCIQS
jgi:hypothetical protein